MYTIKQPLLSVADPGIVEPGGGAVQARYYFLGLEILHLPYAFVLIENREYNTHCKHCMLITIKYMHVLRSTFSKLNP